MARKEEPLQMRIGEAKQRDVGKKRARIGPEAMDYLKVAPSDVIEISGTRLSCAVVWPADEDEKYPDVIRVDGQTRKNIASALNDIVKIKKVTTKVAKSVVLMPVTDSVQCVARIASRIGIAEKTKRYATKVLKQAQENEVSAGKDPMGLAAAALYLSCVRNGEDKTQRDIAEAANVTEVTIRNRYKGLKESLDL